MQLPKGVTATEFLKEVPISKVTFAQWLRRGKLEEAIAFKKPTKNGFKNYYDKDKLLWIIKGFTQFKIEEKDGKIEAKAPLKARTPAEKAIKKQEKEIAAQKILEASIVTVEKNSTVGGNPTYNESRAEKEMYAALTAQLEYEKLVKNLVEVKEVKKTYFNYARTVRNSLMSIPGRVAAEVAALKDVREIEGIITREILETLEGLENVQISGS